MPFPNAMDEWIKHHRHSMECGISVKPDNPELASDRVHRFADHGFGFQCHLLDGHMPTYLATDTALSSRSRYDFR